MSMKNTTYAHILAYIHNLPTYVFTDMQTNLHTYACDYMSTNNQVSTHTNQLRIREEKQSSVDYY